MVDRFRGKSSNILLIRILSIIPLPRNSTRRSYGRPCLVRSRSRKGGFRDISSVRRSMLLQFSSTERSAVEQATRLVPELFTNSCNRTRCRTFCALISCAWRVIHHCLTSIFQQSGQHPTIATDVAIQRVYWRLGLVEVCTSTYSKLLQKTRKMAPNNRPNKMHLGGYVLDISDLLT